MERRDSSGERELRYSSLRARLLHTMCIEAWGNEGNADVEAPTGAFWRITNHEADVPELEDAFGAEASALDVDVRQVLGHWLVTELAAGWVVASPYDTEAELLEDFLPLARSYDEWRTSEGVQE